MIRRVVVVEKLVMKTWAIAAIVAYVSLCFVGITAPAHEDVTTQQAKNMIDGNDPPFLLDVREINEYCDESGGHIPGAVLYPWTSGVLGERYEELPPQRRILIICRSGNRSHHAANFLEDNGFPYVYDMLGGMTV